MANDVEGPGILGYTEPVNGSGVLHFYQDLANPVSAGRWTFKFKAPRAWHREGPAPFGWDFVPPLGKRVSPTLRIVAARDVRITQEIRPSRRDRFDEVGLGSQPLSARNPDLQIFRPQHFGADTGVTERFAPYQILHPLFYLRPPEVNTDRRNHLVRAVRVATQPERVEIVNVFGWFSVSIQARDRNKPTAFWYVIPDAETANVFPFSVFVVHNPNVKVMVRAGQKMEHFVRVTTIEVPHTSQVPFQGEDIPDLEKFAKPYRVRLAKVGGGTGLKDALIDVFESVVSAIPVFGDLYDFSQWAYAAQSGKDFWGRDVNQAQLVLLGAAIVLPFGLRSRSLAKSIAGDAAGDLVPLINSFDELADIASPNLQRAIVNLPETARAEIRDAAKQAIKGGSPQPLFDALRRHVGSNGQALERLQLLDEAQREGTARLFREDQMGLRNLELDAEYQREVRSRGRRRVPQRTALEWAVRRRADGRLGKLLAKELGDDWKTVLARILGPEAGIVTVIPPEAIERFDSLAGKILSHRTLRADLEGFGKFWESDHLLEQRFWRNDPRIDSFAELEESFAIVVPKNKNIARLLGGNIAYVHTDKTNLLRHLIPHGKETRFTVQQIWDAHSFTFRSLGADKMVFDGQRVRDMFSIYQEILVEAGVDQRSTALRFRHVSADAFTAEAGWPVFRR